MAACISSSLGHIDHQYSFKKVDDDFFNINKLPCLKMVAASLYIPKNNPKKLLGEDAHFIYESYQTIGVADGVGYWAKLGINAGIYARKLMRNSIKRAARKGKIIYKSQIQQKGFGCPYQLGKYKDNPSIAQEMELIVEKDDILIVETDGMLDNMNESEIEKIVRKGINRKLKAEELVGKIGKVVWYNSFDRFADTPYAKTAKREGLSQTHKGGKIDDITVIIAYIN
ncbi:probable protein phosphatase 2C 55 [Solanum dulcamara]|uniref:probable protein phosphatase 2C 55 n=1 Tax=Solanum dulcamara TaxID=45834 RepID=UPI0024853D11|nr:probable protein phosphatase 2C 55 [Solanum dulcamara]